VGVLTEHVRATVAKDPADSDFVYRQATRAKALDAARGILPAAAASNVGIYGSGQAFEQLVLRLRAHPLPEAKAYGQLVLHELRKVIPSFLRRVDLPDRGGAWTDYLEATRSATTDSRIVAVVVSSPITEINTATGLPPGTRITSGPAGSRCNLIMAANTYR
jgi:thymidylate synthase ThyX